MVGLLRPRTVYLMSNECALFSVSLRCDFSVSSSPYCILKSAMNFQKVVAIVKPFLEAFCQQTFSVLIARTLLCSMHACYCSLDTDFFSE